jgi:copper transport protein
MTDRQRRQAPIRLPALALLVGIVLLCRDVRPAAAHANLVQSDPPAQSSVTQAPAQIQLLFSEALEPRFIEVSVLDRDRKRVDAEDARLLEGTNDTVVASLGSLPPGLYTISWQVVSAVDGHTTRGLVPFNVGDPGAIPAPLSAEEISAASSDVSEVQSGPAGVIARWLMLLSLLGLGGLVVAGPLLLRPAEARLVAMAERKDETEVAEDVPARVTDAVIARLLRLTWILLGLFLAGSLLLLLVDAAAATGSSLVDAIGSPVADLLGTRRGVYWLIRVGLAVVLALWLDIGLDRKRRPVPPAVWWGGAALVAAMLLTVSLTSHSAALSAGAGVAIAADWIHLSAASVWVGGLIFLLLALLPALGPVSGPGRTRLLADLVPRFSTVAAASVAIVFVTGAFQTLQLLDRLGDITEIRWGRALLIKVALVLVLVALGAFNLLVVRPRLTAYARRMDRGTRELAAALRLRFRRAVLVEVVVAAIVVLIAGVLTGVPPDTSAQLSGPDGPFRPFVLEQSTEGLNGRLVLSPGRIGNNRFDLSLTREDRGPIADGTSAVLRITTLDQDTGTAEVPLEALSAGRFTAAGPFLSTVGLWEIAAIVRQPGRDDVVLPFVLSLTESTGQPQVEENRPAAPLARGREIFENTCAQCHGSGGRGDGPLAAGLRPPPVDLTVHVPLHGDRELENWIANGIPRTAMPAFGSQFSPEEIQAVINYLRELARQSGSDR